MISIDSLNIPNSPFHADEPRSLGETLHDMNPNNWTHGERYKRAQITALGFAAVMSVLSANHGIAETAYHALTGHDAAAVTQLASHSTDQSRKKEAEAFEADFSDMVEQMQVGEATPVRSSLFEDHPTYVQNPAAVFIPGHDRRNSTVSISLGTVNSEGSLQPATAAHLPSAPQQ